MPTLRAAIILCVVLALNLAVDGDNLHKRVVNKRNAGHQTGGNSDNQWLCQFQPTVAQWMGINCQSSPTPAATTPMMTTTTTTTTTTQSTTSTSTVSASPLERATWCRLSNGTYLALGYTYMSSLCSWCQCTQSRVVRCAAFQCMPTYCIDNSTPIRKTGQCCTQCNYDNLTNACTYQGFSYPHGTIIKSVNNVNCWCQLGQIECRPGVGALFGALSLFGDGTAVYIVVIIIGVVILFGTLMCCGCTIFFYYYYQRNQLAFQQVYDQYTNSAGWQPMADETGVAEVDAEYKQTEAEQGQLETEQYLAETQPDNKAAQVYMPPPYALYNGAYVSEEQHNQKKI